MKCCDPMILGFLLSCILRNPDSESRFRQLEEYKKMVNIDFSNVRKNRRGKYYDKR